VKQSVSWVELGMGLMAGLAFAPVAGEWLALVVALLFGLVAHRWLPWRYSTSARRQRQLFAWLGAPFLLLTVQRMVGSRSTIDTSLGIAILGTVYVWVCAVVELYRRSDQARPEVYHMGMMTVMMVGGISSGNRLYPVFLLLYFMLAVALLRCPFGGWWGRSGLDQKSSPGWGVALAFAVALPLAFLARSWLPNGGRLLTRLYSQGLMTNPLGNAYLFGATSDLRSVQRMEASRAVVARVSGPNTVLRGQVYVDYRQGRWSVPIKAERRIEFKVQEDGWIQLPGEVPPVARQWTISPVKDVSGAIPCPTGAYRVRGLSELSLDSYDGLIGDTIEPYTVVASDTCSQRSPSRIPPSSDEYLRLPEPLVQPLLAWSEAIVGEGEPASTLSKYLAQHGVYDPQARRRPDRDPVVAFLEGGLHGHCELFASTLALALRTRGIPTRYVVGFQLAEKNPWGGYYIVRDRDAHAWIEAYVQGSWVSLDPTPSAQFEATHPEGASPSLLEGLVDGFKSLLAAALSGLRRATLPTRWLLLATLSPLLWVALRRPQLGSQWTTRVPARDRAGHLLGQLEKRLGRLGLQRLPQETVLEFAERLPSQLTAESAAAYSHWLQHYAAVRFGSSDQDLSELFQHLPRPVKNS
jgi:transglutaminase-like putative cysteine protease